MLEDYNSYVQVAAAEALGRLGDKSAVKPLINALKGERNSTGVRQAAAEALGRIGDKSAIKPLKALLKDARYYVRLGAETALDQLQE